MKNGYDVEELRSIINGRLAAYSKDAKSYRRAKASIADSSRSLIRYGSLAAAIPLAAAGTAAAQCQGSAAVTLTASTYASTTGTVTVGGINFYFIYYNYAKSVFLSAGPNGRFVVNGTPSAPGTTALRFPSSSVITNGLVTRSIARLCSNYDSVSDYFGSFCVNSGFMGIVDVGANPDRPGWMELSLSASGGTATITIAERGFEIAGGDNTAHTGNCTSLDIVTPVELVSFHGVFHDGEVVLSWETASELNNAGFELQRAAPNGTFQKVTFVEGHGTTTDPQSYQFRDGDIQPNTHYRYRLKQIDLDGATSLSDVVEVFTEDPSQIALSEFYPNPSTNGRARLKMNLAEPAEAVVSIFDVRGSLVDSKSRSLNAGENVFVFQTDDLAAGPHFAKVQVGQRVLYRQFIVAK